MDITPFFPAISGALGGAVTSGVFKGPIQTLEDWWYVNFGNNLSNKAAILKAKQEIEVNQLKDSILNNVSKISPENIQEPKLKILGPALEASKYYIEEEELREMFAKIISSSMDSSKNNVIHPAFVEIIKQLTPLDAENLKSLFTVGGQDIIGKLVFSADYGRHEEANHVFITNKNCTDYKLIQSSIDNLIRLGLIEVTYSQRLLNNGADQKYEQIKSTQIYQSSNKIKDVINQQIANTDNPELVREAGGMIKSLDIIRGIITLTSFGKNFCSICL